MLLRNLRLVDFRNYPELELAPAPGLTVVVGQNGQGKTNLIEAISYLSTLASFRGVPTEVLVRDGAEEARLRAEVDHEGRRVTLDAHLPRRGQNRTEVNGQRLGRSRDLLGLLRCTVFMPDDLDLVKGGPGERRRYLDDLLSGLSSRTDQLRMEVDRVLRQRAVLLKQSGGRLTEDVGFTLDVWDAKLAELGTALAEARRELAGALAPHVRQHYGELAGRDEDVVLRYDPAWLEGGLAAALAASRREDLRRAVTTVGPHRDDVALTLRGTSSRTHASQGEQRSLALALRLAGHDLVAARTGSVPILLLDDVFSELDPARTAALVRFLPEGQTLLTTAEAIPEGAHPELVVRVESGAVQVEAR